MYAEVVKIYNKKMSRNGKYTFQRIGFVLLDGSWAKTDVCPFFRNYKWWKPVLDSGVGTKITNLIFTNENEINADSRVKIIN